MKDIDLSERRWLRIEGKGRKERIVPLWKTTQVTLVQWLDRTRRDPEVPLFPNRAGNPLSRTGVEERLRRTVLIAAELCPSLRRRRVSPHTLRHTTAMHLLQSGVDVTVIALWLRHDSPETTHQYVEADLEMKRKALDTLAEPNGSTSAWHPNDSVLAFLDSL